MHFCLGTTSLSICFSSLCPLLVLCSVTGSPQDASRCMSQRVLSHVQLFTTPWTVAHQLPCPWNCPGKNTEWAAVSFSRGPSSSRNWTHISCVSCPGRWNLCHRVASEAHPDVYYSLNQSEPKTWSSSTTIGQKTTRKGEEGWREDAGGRCTGKGPGSAVACRTEASCHTLLSLPPGWSLESLTGFSSLY